MLINTLSYFNINFVNENDKIIIKKSIMIINLERLKLFIIIV